MRNPFDPPSLYQNYQPPPQGADLYMPMPGWGWPADSAGPRRVGVNGLGESYDVTLPIVGRKSVELPIGKAGADLASGAVEVLRAELPGIIESARKEVTFTVVKGALLAAAIGAAAIFGYKYVTGK